jgi:hypothetical protein
LSERVSLTRLKALTLLSECTGDDIWSVDHCRLRHVPESWIEELANCFESGFQDEGHTIFVGRTTVSQYYGLRDVDLAIKLGEFLGVEVTSLVSSAATRSRLVIAIRQAIEEE